MWEVRGAILEGMKADSVAQEECDVVVPRSEIAEYVKTGKEDCICTWNPRRAMWSLRRWKHSYRNASWTRDER